MAAGTRGFFLGGWVGLLRACVVFVSLCFLVTKQEIMIQPVRRPCSHTYDRVSLELWATFDPNARKLRGGHYTIVKDIWNKNHKDKQTKTTTTKKKKEKQL